MRGKGQIQTARYTKFCQTNIKNSQNMPNVRQVYICLGQCCPRCSLNIFLRKWGIQIHGLHGQAHLQRARAAFLQEFRNHAVVVETEVNPADVYVQNWLITRAIMASSMQNMLGALFFRPRLFWTLNCFDPGFQEHSLAFHQVSLNNLNIWPSLFDRL